jgi:hypothetical protein
VARRNGSRPAHATLYDFRDLDLLLKIEAEADEEGWVETAHAASALGFDDNAIPVARRFSWMRRYGMLEFDQQRKMWRLTPAAERVTEARLRAAQTRTIEELPDEVMVDVMSKVTQRYLHGSPMIATMLRREFHFGTQPR